MVFLSEYDACIREHRHRSWSTFLRSRDPMKKDYSCPHGCRWIWWPGFPKKPNGEYMQVVGILPPCGCKPPKIKEP